MSLSHLIAVNCHPFHGIADIQAGLASLARAVGVFRQRTRDFIEVRVFWHHQESVPAVLQDQIDAEGFSVTHAPHRSNGDNLNAQIEYAISKGFDVFFRVDGDDTVTAQRFIRQAEMLENDECDICGGALRYKPKGEQAYVMIPNPEPGARDYIENQFMLHPSMAFRVDALRKTGLRYWSRRLEDKALLLAARRAGLRVRNVPAVSGGYNVGPRSRSKLSQKWLGFRLNVAFLWHERALHLVPYAAALFVGQVLLGSTRLRRLRYMLHRRSAAGLRASDTT